MLSHLPAPGTHGSDVEAECREEAMGSSAASQSRAGLGSHLPDILAQAVCVSPAGFPLQVDLEFFLE